MNYVVLCSVYVQRVKVLEKRTFVCLREVSEARVVIAGLLLGSLLGKFLGCQVISASVLLDKKELHDHDEERGDKHHNL